MARKRWKGVSSAERSRIAAEAGKMGGRPKKITACPRCGYRDGVVAMRAHKCPQERA